MKPQNVAPATETSMLVQTFVENLQIIPVSYLRDRTPPLDESKAFDLTDDLRIRPTLESERRAFYRNQGTDPEKAHIMENDTLCCVIEATTKGLTKIDPEELRKARSRTRFAWLALLLYFGKISKVRRVIMTEGTFVELGSDSQWAKFIPATWIHNLPLLDRFDSLP
jgi:hypothetical protein